MAITRRRFAIGGAVALGAVALARPTPIGAPHSAYFLGLSQALRAAGIATPTMIIDRSRMQANVRKIQENIAGKVGLRLVIKSLPVPALIDEIQSITQQRAMMAFSLPHLHQMFSPTADILLGKPMPALAAASFYQKVGNPVAGSDHIQWLVDTPERLAQYRELARSRDLALSLNVEIDVGLHRGGVSNISILREMLGMIAADPRLRLRGLMGYDAHITKLPNVGGLQERAKQHAREVYAGFAKEVNQFSLGHDSGKLTFNAGGSPTYRLFDGSGFENEVSVGSAMVKASDFDTPLLADLQPALFIATPVLKVPELFDMPYGVEWLGTSARVWDRNETRAYFIYGGNWLADPVSPTGLRASSLYGTSSNQQVLVGSGQQALKPDDYVFFRPRQSEAVMLQFGDIAVYEGGTLNQFWKPMAATA